MCALLLSKGPLICWCEHESQWVCALALVFVCLLVLNILIIITRLGEFASGWCHLICLLVMIVVLKAFGALCVYLQRYIGLHNQKQFSQCHRHIYDTQLSNGTEKQYALENSCTTDDGKHNKSSLFISNHLKTLSFIAFTENFMA